MKDFISTLATLCAIIATIAGVIIMFRVIVLMYSDIFSRNTIIVAFCAAALCALFSKLYVKIK